MTEVEITPEVSPTPSKWGTSVLSVITRLILGTVFVFSGVPKLLSPAQFYDQVAGFELVSAPVATWVVYAVPVLELLLAVCLFLGVLLGGAWTTAVVIMMGFTLLHLRVVWLDQEITCGCFDPEGTQLIGWWTVSRNALLLVVSMMGWLSCWYNLPRKLEVPDPSPPYT